MKDQSTACFSALAWSMSKTKRMVPSWLRAPRLRAELEPEGGGAVVAGDVAEPGVGKVGVKQGVTAGVKPGGASSVEQRSHQTG